MSQKRSDDPFLIFTHSWSARRSPSVHQISGKSSWSAPCLCIFFLSPNIQQTVRYSPISICCSIDQRYVNSPAVCDWCRPGVPGCDRVRPVPGSRCVTGAIPSRSPGVWPVPSRLGVPECDRCLFVPESRSVTGAVPSRDPGVCRDILQPAWRQSAARRPSPARHTAGPAERNDAAPEPGHNFRSLNWFRSVTDIYLFIYSSDRLRGDPS